jgi:predicted nucleotidyltransferase
MLRDPAILTQTLDPTQRAALERLASAVRGLLGERLDRILLFGSRARGDAEPDSDIDVLVLTRGDPLPDDRRALSSLAADLQVEAASYLPLSLVLMSRDRFSDLRAHERRFALEVERQGISL